MQSRLTVATLALTALVFSGSFTLALFNANLALYNANLALSDKQPGAEQQSEYRVAFSHDLTALCLGIIFSLGAIACFLQAQHSEPQSESGRQRRFRNRLWWFSSGQIFLYVALAQAMSACLTEVVFGIHLSAPRIAQALAIAAMPIWWAFLFVGPVVFLRSRRAQSKPVETIVLAILYLLTVLFVLVVSGAEFSVRGQETFGRGVIEQFYQPLTWTQPWAD